MKKLILSCAICTAALLAASCSKPGITVKISGLDETELTVAHMNLKDYPVPNDSDPRVKKELIKLKNGRAVITPDSLPSLYVISPASASQAFIRMIVEPQDRITIRFKADGNGYIYTASGSAAADGMTDYLETVHSTDVSIDSMVNLLNGDPDNKGYFDIYDSLFTVRRMLTAVWIRHNADNPSAALLLRNAPLDSVPALYDAIDEGLRTSHLAPLIDETKHNSDRRIATRKAAEATVPGAEAPDFTLNDPDGKPVTLSSLRGKWVVLDFWGTWCGWCIKGIPEMKKYEEKYRKRCTFVSIDCFDTPERWKEGLEKHQMPWIQVYNPDDAPLDKNAIVLYGVQGYPTKIIIDPDGRIHKVFAGEGPDFYKELDAVL